MKFTTPVSMLVNQEQAEYLKGELEKLGYSGYRYSDDEEYPAIVTNFTNHDRSSNVLEEVIHDDSRHFIDHYNPGLFLALAAMNSGNKPIIGEYLLITNKGDSTMTVGDIVKAENPIGGNKTWFICSTNGKGNRSRTSSKYSRKATKEELIKHFMKEKTPRKHAEIAKLYHSDKSIKIQYRYDGGQGNWRDNDNPAFNDNFEYRIKPTEPELIPYSFEDADYLRDLWIVKNDDKEEFKITGVGKNRVLLGYWYQNFKELFENFTTIDGKPLGKFKQ